MKIRVYPRRLSGKARSYSPVPLAPDADRCSGFALVIALSLMAFILLLLLSLTSFVRVETGASATSLALTEARANALLGVKIAAGELQKYAGADQRVTANATVNGFQDLSDEDNDWPAGDLVLDASNPSPDDREDREDAYQGYWQGRNPRWTGIWSSRVARESGSLQGYANRSFRPAWLISGNEAFDVPVPTDGDFGQDSDYEEILADGYLTPYMTEDEIAAAAQSVPGRWNGTLPPDELLVDLVGAASSALSDTADGLPGAVRAPRMPIRGGEGDSKGSYAYWVSDESLKANVALRDPFFDETNTSSVEYRNRLIAPQRLGWESIDGFGPAAPFVDDERIEVLTGVAQLPLFDPDNLTAPTSEHFHSLTMRSTGLLTDTRLGGLRKDLTVYLEGSGGPKNNDRIATASGSYPLAPGEFHNDDQRFQISGSRPGWVDVFEGDGFPASLTNIPTWGKLKSWFDNVGDATAAIEVRPSTATESGVFPMMVYYQSIFGGSVESNNVGAQFNLHVTPVIVLWNPFDAELETHTYTFVVDRRVRQEYFGWIPMGDWSTPHNPGDHPSAPDYENDGDGEPERNNPAEFPSREVFVWPNLRFEITTAFEPGEMIAFTINQDQQVQFYADDLKEAYPTDHPVINRADVEETESNFSNYNTKLSEPIELTPGWPDPSAINYAWGPGEDTDGTIVRLDLELLDRKNFPTELIDYDNDFFRISAGSQTDNPYGDLMDNAGFLTFPLVMLSEDDEVLSIAQQWKIEGVQQFTHEPGRWHKGPGDGNPGEGNATHGPDPLVLRSDYAAMIAGTFDPAPDTLSGIQDPGLLVLPDNTLHFSPLFAEDPTTNNKKNLNNDLRLTQRIFSNHNITSDHAWASPADRLRGRLEGHNEDGMPWMPQFRTTRAGGPESLIAFNRDVSLDSSPNGISAAGVLFPDQDYPVDDYSLESLAVRPVRRPASKVLSLGQLQGANLSPFYHQPMNPVGNSEAPAYVDRAKIAGLSSVRIAEDNRLATPEQNEPLPNDEENNFLDLSYLLNEALWDSYFLSGIPQSGGIADELAGRESLPNGRLRFRGELEPAAGDVRDFDQAAAFLTNVGAFNVNSTSVAAWKSFLAAFRDLELDNTTPDGVTPMTRVLDPIAEAVDFSWPDHADADSYGASGGIRNSDNVLGGYRYLTDEMLQELAERIVDEVRLRGPFYSLGDFVNRRLVAPHSGEVGGESGDESPWGEARDASGGDGAPQRYPNNYDPIPGLAGLNGALQRAINLSGINGGVNYPAGMPSESDDRIFNYGHTARPHDNDPRPYEGIDNSKTSVMRPEVRHFYDSEHLAGAPVGEYGSTFSHAPGMMSQGDLLSAIGAALTARGDTFVVRAYGDSISPVSGEVEARVWCEAVLQRLPEPVDAKGNNGEDRWESDPNAGPDFGRQFRIVQFRWLNEEEI